MASVQEWCCCYRKGLQVNTNMALESMHRIVKQNYFNGKVVKRLDIALNLILVYLDDKRHDNLIKTIKGKITLKNTDIWNRHRKAIQYKDGYKVKIVGETYLVCGREMDYTVKIAETCENDSCGLMYNDCGICLHRVSCNCFVNSIHFEFCVHCHVATMYSRCNNSSDACSSTIQSLNSPHDQPVDVSDQDFDISDVPEIESGSSGVRKNLRFTSNNWHQKNVQPKI